VVLLIHPCVVERLCLLTEDAVYEQLGIKERLQRSLLFPVATVQIGRDDTEDFFEGRRIFLILQKTETRQCVQGDDNGGGRGTDTDIRRP